MKYLKTYEQSANKKFGVKEFWLLPSEKSRYLKAIMKIANRPENINIDIDDYNKAYECDYIYIGSSIFGWQYSPYIYYDEGFKEFGDIAFLDDHFKFVGYIDLTPEEIENIKIEKEVKKYNL